MKKLLSFFITLLFVHNAFAQQEVDGIFYNLDANNKTAEVCDNYDFYSGNVIIPETVTCDGVTYTVTSIGDFAFYDCGDLRYITLPESISYIGMYSFQNCHKLKSVNIPDNVKVIGEQAFGECSAITEAVIPSGIEELGVSAFEGCSSMTNINIGDGIRTIPSSLFSRCESLTEVTLPKSVESIGDWAFTNCISLKNIKLNEGLENINECAFAFCTALESVSLPSTVKSIGNDVFNHCTGMKYIELSENLESIGNYIFDNCEMLGYIRCRSVFPANVYLDKLMDYCEQTILFVPAGAKESYAAAKGWDAFNQCMEIGENETIDYSLKRIDTEDMSFIVSPLDSRLAKTVCRKNEEKYSGDIVIPSVVKDENGTEYTVNHIGEGTFELCIDVSSVVIPTSVTSIGEWAFSGAQTLPTIEIPTSVTKIGNAAFFGCASMKSVTLHSMLQYIGQDAFSGCFQLYSVYSEMDEPFMIPDHAFDFFEEQTLYVPNGCKHFYKYTDYWWMFMNIREYDVDGIDDVTVENNDDRLYDLQGRRVNEAEQGIYINNGKKIVF